MTDSLLCPLRLCLLRRSNSSIYGILGPVLCNTSHLACFRNAYAWKVSHLWWLPALEGTSQMLPPPSSPRPQPRLLSYKEGQMPYGIFSKLPFRFPSIPAIFLLLWWFLGGSLRKLLRIQTLPGCIFMGAHNWAQNASCDQLWKHPHLWLGWSLSSSQGLHRPVCEMASFCPSGYHFIMLSKSRSLPCSAICINVKHVLLKETGRDRGTSKKNHFKCL